MKINLSSQDKEKVIKLLETKEANISIADLLFSTFNHPEYEKPQTDYFSYLLALMDIDPNDNYSVDFIKKSVGENLQEYSLKNFLSNKYIKNVKINKTKNGPYELNFDSYKAFEPFAFDDISVCQQTFLEKYKIGYFKTDISYPYISYKRDIWMLITPNEINTMEPAIREAKGNVVVYGLGLGYFPYMIEDKNDVQSITIVENDPNIIKLFSENIYRYFNNKSKIKIVSSDAFKFMKYCSDYDYAFIDLWHNPTDGLPLYLKAKKLERPQCKYFYWLEESILAMLRRCILTIIEENFQGYTDKDYLKAKNSYDEIINALYRKLRTCEINSYSDILILISSKKLKSLY